MKKYTLIDLEKYNLTTQDLAIKFDVSETTIRNWAKQGLPYISTGASRRKKYKFNTEEVEKWFNEQQIVGD